MKPISVIIPNFNGTELLKSFLPTTVAAMRSGDQLIIVDDASTDTSMRYLTQKFDLVEKKLPQPTQSNSYKPQLDTSWYKTLSNTVTIEGKRIEVVLVSLQKNLRFAAAVNTGVLFSIHNYLFVQNTDVKLTRGIFEKLLSHFDNPEVFAVGCLEYENDTNGEVSGKNKLWFSQGLYVTSKADDFLTGKTAWVSGGSGMFEKNKWMQLNGFDLAFYPAYWEDIDISFRAQKKGWITLFDQTAVIFHVHESTNSGVFGSDKILKMSWKNADTFVRKNGTIWQKIVFYLYKPWWLYKRAQVAQSWK